MASGLLDARRTGRARAQPRTRGSAFRMNSILRFFAALCLVAAAPVRAQTVCADPGRDGNQLSVSGIVNTYYPATEDGAVNETSITLGAARGASTPIAVGDLLLAIQMQDGTIDSNNNDGYGDNTDGDGTARGTTASAVGQYEFLRAASAVPLAGGTLTLVGVGSSGGLVNAYEQGNRATNRGRQTWQIIRVPQYRNATLGGTVTAPYWNGATGGVVVIDSVGKVALNGQSIDVSGRGFRGGGILQLAGGAGANTDYRTNATVAANASKGEGIAGTPRYVYNQETGAVVDFSGGDEGYNNGSFARGAPGNAGGGGTDGNPAANDENSGGGGGGNGGIGGQGGNTWQSNLPRGGFGGAAFATTFTRVVLGGGGGAGTRNNSAGVVSSGGAGGGIVIIRAGYFQGPGSILADGATGPAPDNDGGGGGGAGGSIVLKSDPATTFNALTTITLRANGGAGTDTWITQPPGGTPGNRHGPGGGGAGGVIWTGSNMTTFAARLVNGGAAGRTTSALDVYGANGGSGFVGTATFTGQLPGVNPGYECVTTPVTLAFAASAIDSRGTQLRWTTATETGNVAFRVYEGAPGRRRPATLAPVASLRTSTAERSDYSLALRAPPLDGQWWLADVDVAGQERLSGPFVVGTRYGAEPADARIDWRAVRTQLAAPRAKALGGASTTARVRVADAGFQRVSFEALLAAGVDLAGVPAAEIAVSQRGAPVTRHVTGPATFGPGSAVEFFGEPERSLYVEQGVYLVERNAAAARDIPSFADSAGAPVAAWSYAEATYAPERQYNIGSPTSDPWYAERLLAYAGTPASFATTLTVDAVAAVPRVAPEARADFIGVTQWPGAADDHRVSFALDGGPAVASTADGLSAWSATYAAPALGDGAHELRVTATGDTGFDFDLVYVDALAVRYPRLPVARDGRWLGLAVATNPAPTNAQLGTLPGATPNAELLADGFETASAASGGSSIVVHGFAGSDLVAYRRLRGAWERVLDVRSAPEAGGYAAYAAAGDVPGGDWWVSTSAGLLRPAIEALPPETDILSGPAAWLVVTVPALRDALAPLAARRSAQGLTTDIVDVDQIYRRYSGGSPDPAAITAYLREAVAARGTRYVLIAGADTYDYADHLGIGSVSFVPTRYARTSDVIAYAPSDALLADLDGDERADLPIGRLPARSPAELSAVVAKLLAYEAGASREVLLVAGAAEAGGSFRSSGEEFALQLPGEWQLARAYVDDLGVAGARSALLDGFGRGPAIVSFFGHSAPGQWTFDPIFTAADVAALGNTGRPALVLQWGCWNTYFVAPASNTLAHALLLTPDRGAAAAFGSTALTEVASHVALGGELYPHLAAGARLGDVVLAAQRSVAAGAPSRRDAWLGTALLGDPAMPLR